MYVVVDTKDRAVHGPFATRSEATHWAASRPMLASDSWWVARVTQPPVGRS